jgi:hypothetical protein
MSYVYYLTVVPELNSVNQNRIVEVLKAEAKPNANNTFLFISAHSKDGDSTAATMEQMRQLGIKMKEDIGKKLEK